MCKGQRLIYNRILKKSLGCERQDIFELAWQQEELAILRAKRQRELAWERLMQREGRKAPIERSVKVVGIDLGTTNSCSVLDLKHNIPFKIF